MDIAVEVDCGNAPKKAQVRDFVIAVAQGDIDFVTFTSHSKDAKVKAAVHYEMAISDDV